MYQIYSVDISDSSKRNYSRKSALSQLTKIHSNNQAKNKYCTKRRKQQKTTSSK